MITATKNGEVMHFDETATGTAWADAFQQAGWTLYDDSGEVIPAPQIKIREPRGLLFPYRR